MTTLVVSPHLDDAVLSLPAWLAATSASVVVMTVFSEGDEQYPQRRAEDLAALAELAVTAVHLGLVDAPERRGLPRSFRALVLGELEEGDTAAVLRVLLARISELSPTRILLPLGVGEHVDHRVVHAAHRQLPGPVGFYEDRPYALVRHAVRARLRCIGAVVEGDREDISPAQAAAEFLASARAAPHIRALIPAAEREACLAPLAAMLTAPTDIKLRLRREVHEFAEPGARAVAAVRAYASQLPALFGAEDPLAYLLGDCPHRECIYWRLSA